MQNNNEKATINGNISVTQKDVETVARRVTNDPSTTLISYHFGEISETKLGILGDHKNLNITYKRKDNNHPEEKQLFIKSIPSNEQQKEFVNNNRFFLKEKLFFEKVAPELLKDYVVEKWSPTCYFTTNNELIMENLNSQGYKLMDTIFDQSLLLKSVLSTLARFHSCTILSEFRLSQDAKEPVTFNDRFPDSLTNLLLTKTLPGHDYYVSGCAIIIAFAEQEHLNCQSLRKALNAIYDKIKPSKTCPNAICHNDLWQNNMMFCDTSDSPKCVLVDFQTIVYGPVVLDILQLLYLNSSFEYRAEFEKDLIEFYHSALEKTIKSNDPVGNVEMPKLADLLTAYEELRLYGVVYLSYYYPFSFIRKAMNTSPDDSETYMDYIFSDRTTLTLAQLEQDECAKNEFRNIVLELISIGDKID